MPKQQQSVQETSEHGSTDRPKWRQLVRWALDSAGGEANLQVIYTLLEERMPRDWLTPTWKAKVRQQLQLDPRTTSVARGVWRLEDWCP